MKSKIRVSFCVFLLSSIAALALGAEFDTNSTNITNTYFLIEVGDRAIFSGYGDWEGDTGYWDVVGTEVVDEVKCLKVNRISTNEDNFVTFWFAQDTEGNVWVLKIYYKGTTFTLGDGILFWFMPADPQVGDKAAVIMPASDNTYCEVVETSVTVPQLSTGLGPFSDCIRVRCRYNGVFNEEVEYYCHSFWGVRRTEANHESDWGMDIKAVISTECRGDFDNDSDVDGEDLRIFSEHFGTIF